VIHRSHSRNFGYDPAKGLYIPNRPGLDIPPPWNPSNKSGLLFWFKADSGVTQSSGLVSQWNDNSANLYHGTASGGQRPTYNAAALNGLPTISFPSGTWLDFAGSNALFTAGSPFSMICVARQPAFSGVEYRAGMTLNSATFGRRFALLYTNDGSYGDINWAHTGSLMGTGPQPTVRASGSLSSASSLLISYNGGTVTSAASWTTYLATSVISGSAGGNSQTDGSNSKLGSWYDGSLNWIGEFGEVFAYNSEPDAGELTNIFDYIFNKWGVL